MKQKRFLSMFALLLMAATGAWAQTETLLTTITPTGDASYDETTPGVVTVTLSNENGWFSEVHGWCWFSSGSLTVEAKEGYTITRCVFKQTDKTPVTITTSPFALTFREEVGTCEQSDEFMDGVTSIEVYGNAAAPATTYSITLAEGTEDSDKWTISPAEAAEGATVTATYSGEKKVKSVKAVKKKVGPEVSTFSELQAVLSAGKDVKLMKDIVCTAEIDITSDGALTIDGNGKTLSATSAIRAFKVESSATVAFKNLTLTGFVNGGGPAINNDGTIVLDGCTISNCHVNNSNGGGAIESTGKLYAVNTTFSGNYSGEIGGAINNYWGSLYMTDCTFTDNYTTESNAYYGGAIGINGGDEVRLINCVFSGNKYGTTAGTNDIGVYNKPTNYTIAGCTGVTIASRGDVGNITTIASGTATLDYSDLSNISFTYTPVTVTLTPGQIGELNKWASSKNTINGITIEVSGDAHFTNYGSTGMIDVYETPDDPADLETFSTSGSFTFTSSVGKIKRIDINHNGGKWWGAGDGWPGSYEVYDPSTFTWSGTPAASVTLNGYYAGMEGCNLNDFTSIVFTLEK